MLRSLWCRNEVIGFQCPAHQNARPSGETTGRWDVHRYGNFACLGKRDEVAVRSRLRRIEFPVRERDQAFAATAVVPFEPARRLKGLQGPVENRLWPAPGSEDTELGVLMELEVGHGEASVYAGVQA